jgi:hypothetical protein
MRQRWRIRQRWRLRLVERKHAAERSREHAPEPALERPDIPLAMTVISATFDYLHRYSMIFIRHFQSPKWDASERRKGPAPNRSAGRFGR